MEIQLPETAFDIIVMQDNVTKWVHDTQVADVDADAYQNAALITLEFGSLTSRCQYIDRNCLWHKMTTQITNEMVLLALLSQFVMRNKEDM